MDDDFQLTRQAEPLPQDDPEGRLKLAIEWIPKIRNIISPWGVSLRTSPDQSHWRFILNEVCIVQLWPKGLTFLELGSKSRTIGSVKEAIAYIEKNYIASNSTQ
jgi:hypothetical protein